MRIFPIFILALILPVAAQSATTKSIAFDVRADGFRFGALSATYAVKGDTYSVSVQAEAQGIIGFFLRARYTGLAQGRLDRGNLPVPDFFTAHSSRIFKSRVQRVDFVDGFPTKVSISPSRDMTPMSNPKLVTERRIDPLSYLGIFIQDRVSGCPPPANMYDGRRLTHISFTEVAAGTDQILCEGFYKIVKGPDHSIQPGLRKFGLEFIYKRTGGPLARLTTIKVTSGSNKIVLRRIGK